MRSADPLGMLAGGGLAEVASAHALVSAVAWYLASLPEAGAAPRDDGADDGADAGWLGPWRAAVWCSAWDVAFGAAAAACVALRLHRAGRGALLASGASACAVSGALSALLPRDATRPGAARRAAVLAPGACAGLVALAAAGAMALARGKGAPRAAMDTLAAVWAYALAVASARLLLSCVKEAAGFVPAPGAPGGGGPWHSDEVVREASLASALDTAFAVPAALVCLHAARRLAPRAA